MKDTHWISSNDVFFRKWNEDTRINFSNIYANISDEPAVQLWIHLIEYFLSGTAQSVWLELQYNEHIGGGTNLKTVFVLWKMDDSL